MTKCRTKAPSSAFSQFHQILPRLGDLSFLLAVIITVSSSIYVSILDILGSVILLRSSQNASTCSYPRVEIRPTTGQSFDLEEATSDDASFC